MPIIFTAAALIISAAIITAEKSMSPYDYIKKHNKDEAFAPAELLYQQTSDDGVCVVFYINGSGKFCCGVLEKTFFGYREAGYGGYRDINSESYLLSRFQESGFDICWGVIDDGVSEVFIDGEKCNIAETQYAFRIFWLTGFWENDPELTKIA